MSDLIDEPGPGPDDVTDAQKPADTQDGADDTQDDAVKKVDKADDDKAKPKTDDDLLSDDGDIDQEGVPDQYTFEAPEGIEVTADVQAELDKFGEQAKEMGLTQAQYQAIVSYDLQRSQSAVEASVGEWNTRVDGWRDATRTDKDIGGDNLQETTKFAKAALKQFGTPGLTELLKSPSEDNPNGLAISNHPEIMRFLSQVGRVIADPTLLEGDTVVPDEGSLQRMYPSMFEKT